MRKLALFFVIISFLNLPSARAQLSEQDQTDAIQKIESKITGQKPSIAKLVQSLAKEGSVTLVFGPEGVGKFSLINSSVVSLGLKGFSFDVSTEKLRRVNNLLFMVGKSVLENNAQVIVLHHTNYLDEASQNILARVLNRKVLKVQFPASAPDKLAQEVMVDLSKTRFVLITDQGDYLFRNPVGFRSSSMHEPESDQFLANLSDESVKAVFQGRVFSESLLNATDQFVPVRRLSINEFRSSIIQRIDEHLVSFKAVNKKNVLIDRHHELVEMLVDRYFIKSKSTYHDINDLVSSALNINADESHVAEVFKKAKTVLLTWSEDSLGTIPEIMNCNALAKGKKPKLLE